VFALEPLAMVAALVILWRHRFRLRSSASLNALGLYLAASLLATGNVTDMPRHLYGLMQFGLAGVMLYALTAVRPRLADLDDLIRLSPLVFVCLALIVLASALSEDLLGQAGSRKLAIGHGGSNFLASMLLLGAFVPLAGALGEPRRRGRLFSLLAFALIVAGIAATASRAAMVIAPIGCLATALVMRPRGRSGWKRLALVVAILGLVLISLAPHFNSLVRAGRFRDPLTQRNLLARVELLHLYREHFLAHPWVGSGHLNGRASPLLAFLGEGNARESEALVWGEHVYAHNWLLQTLADSGVVGGLGFVIFLTLAGKTFVAGVRRSHRWFPISAGLLAGFVAVVLHGLCEPNFHGKPFIYLFVIQLGLAEQIRRVTTPLGRGEVRGERVRRFLGLANGSGSGRGGRRRQAVPGTALAALAAGLSGSGGHPLPPAR
jgi:hypothetical protein